MTLTTNAWLAMIALAGCGSPVHGDPRFAAAQKALDADPPTGAVAYYQVCDFYRPEFRTASYRSVPGAHLGSTVNDDPRCRHLAWDTNVKFGEIVFNSARVPLGRWILDKIGEDQQIQGIRTAPYRAHAEISPLGRALVAAKIAKTPSDPTEGYVYLTKDADGNVQAEVVRGVGP